MIGVVAALNREARILTRMPLTPGQSTKIGAHLLVCVSGMGASRARAAAQALLASGASALLSWGIAAALVPKLKVGTLMLPRAIFAADGLALNVDAGWHDHISRSVPCDIRPLVHTSAILSTPQKHALARSSDAAAADMESAAVAQVAFAAGVPYLAVRAIADELEQAVPTWLPDALDPFGAIELKAFGSMMLRHPLDAPALIGLARAFGKARRTLARFRARTLQEN